MGRIPLIRVGKLVKKAFILVALFLVFFPPSIPGSSFTRISSGCLLVAAGLFFFLGAGEFLRGISLSRRMVLCFFAVVLLWGLTGFTEVGLISGNGPEDHRRAQSLRELGRRIDNVAEIGSGQVRSFVDSSFTGHAGQFLDTVGEVTGAAAGVLIDAVLTSTVDTSSGPADSPAVESGFSGLTSRIPVSRLAVLAVSLLLLSVVGGFIQTDKSRLTLWLYRVAVGMVFASAFFHVFGFRIILSSELKLFEGIELELVSLLLLFASVALAFCQRWVQYLSGRSRFLLLPAALVAVVMIRDSYYRLAGNNHPGMGGLDSAALTVVALYILFSFLTMLLHLPTARILEKRSRELTALQDLSQALHSSFESDQLGMAAVRLGAKLTGADICWFHMKNGEDHIHSRTDDWRKCVEKTGEKWYRGVYQRIDAAGHGFIINNYKRSTLRRMEDSRDGFSRIASLVAAPVEVHGDTLGLILAASSKQFFFVDYTRGLFDSFTKQIAQAFQSARLFGEKLQRQSLEKELELARNIQRSLLPGKLPVPSGWDIEAVSIPCRVMGGDYYDVISLSDRKLAVAVADVSGKGAAAAMLMAALQSSLGTLLKEDLPVAETVRRLNRALCDRMPDATFITFFLAFIDPVTGRIQYCCAGHDPPILCTGSGSDSLAQLDCGGLILGVKPEAEYSMAELDIPQGGRLLLYTDGVTETIAPDDEPFGVHRLNLFMQKHCCETAGSILEKLTFLLEHFRGETDQQDDVTALVIARGIFRE